MGLIVRIWIFYQANEQAHLSLKSIELFSAANFIRWSVKAFFLLNFAINRFLSAFVLQLFTAGQYNLLFISKYYFLGPIGPINYAEVIFFIIYELVAYELRNFPTVEELGAKAGSKSFVITQLLLYH